MLRATIAVLAKKTRAPNIAKLWSSISTTITSPVVAVKATSKVSRPAAVPKTSNVWRKIVKNLKPTVMADKAVKAGKTTSAAPARLKKVTTPVKCKTLKKTQRVKSVTKRVKKALKKNAETSTHNAVVLAPASAIAKPEDVFVPSSEDMFALFATSAPEQEHVEAAVQLPGDVDEMMMGEGTGANKAFVAATPVAMEEIIPTEATPAPASTKDNFSSLIQEILAEPDDVVAGDAHYF